MEVITTIGNGTTTQTSTGKTSVTFSFEPKAVIVACTNLEAMPSGDGQSGTYDFPYLIYLAGMTKQAFLRTNGSVFIGTTFTRSNSNKTITLTVTSSSMRTFVDVLNNWECNVNGEIYYWCAIG